MADIVDMTTRSRMMANIRGKDTKQELEIRKKLFALGFRYRLHDSKLPGTPDIVLLKYNAVIFIHGCFWHVHNCYLFRWPASKKVFWKKKLEGNRKRDVESIELLKKLGLRILIIWECSFRGAGKNYEWEIARVVQKASKWLTSRSNYSEIAA